MSTISASTTSTTAYKVTADTTGTLVLQTGSSPTTAATIDTNQQIGVGVAPNSGWSGFRVIDLQYNGSVQAYSAGGFGLGYNAYFNGGAWVAKSTGSSCKFGLDSNGGFSWQQLASVTGGSAFTYNTAMTLDASGRLGVGVTSPSIAQVEVTPYNSSTGALVLNRTYNYHGNNWAFKIQGDAGTSGAYAGQFGASGGWFITQGYSYWGGGPGYITDANSTTTSGMTLASGVIAFYTDSGLTASTGFNQTERARIDSSGNFMVGSADVTAQSSVFFKPTTGQTTTYVKSVAFAVAETGGSSYPGQYRWYTSTANSGSAYRAGYNLQLRSYDTGQNSETTVATAVNTAWYQGNNSSTWSTTSDQRIKTNIRPITGALEKICALNPCHFEMVNALGEVKTNFIAQEFEQVFPGHVGEMTTPEEFTEYTDSPTIKTVDPNLIPYLTAAIKEQQAIIESLKARLDAANL